MGSILFELLLHSSHKMLFCTVPSETCTWRNTAVSNGGNWAKLLIKFVQDPLLAYWQKS